MRTGSARRAAALLLGMVTAVASVGGSGLVPAGAVALPAAPVAVSGSVGLASPTPARATATRITDVNGDGLADIVYRGRRMAHPENQDDDTALGYVAVLYGGSRLARQEILASDLKDHESEGSFGATVLAADLNRDGYADLVVSDPQSWNAATQRLVGRVWVLWGSATGVSASRSKLLLTGRTYTGYALAYVREPVPVLAVGGRDRVGGSVRLYPVRATGALGTPRVLTLASAGIVGPALAGSQFGAELSASRDLLVVGAPYARVGRVSKAGAAYVVRLSAGLGFHAVRLSQAGSATPGTPERYDRFADAVSVHQGYVAVGVPSEDIGAATQAGEVQAFRVTGSGSRLAATHVVTVTESALGIPGVTTGRDHWWGSGVAVYRPCTGAMGVLVVGRTNVRDSVRVPLTHGGTCPAQVVATGAYDIHHLGILRTAQNSTAAESTEFTVDGGILVTSPAGTSTLWPTPWSPEAPAPPAS